MTAITNIAARQILDSRGNPTVARAGDRRTKGRPAIVGKTVRGAAGFARARAGL
jgi:hypothetical protein